MRAQLRCAALRSPSETTGCLDRSVSVVHPSVMLLVATAKLVAVLAKRGVVLVSGDEKLNVYRRTK